MKNWTFFKTHEIEYTPSTMFKRHYIDEIEYPPSPICGEKPKFESSVPSFQFRQNGILAGNISIELPIFILMHWLQDNKLN